MTRAGTLARDEAGSTTTASALLIAAIAVLAVGLIGAGGVLADQARARTAADLAAVAGAVAGLRSGDEGGSCVAAGRIAGANAADLLDCRRTGEDVTVTVDVDGRRATARAGPTELPPAM